MPTIEPQDTPYGPQVQKILHDGFARTREAVIARHGIAQAPLATYTLFSYGQASGKKLGFLLLATPPFETVDWEADIISGFAYAQRSGARKVHERVYFYAAGSLSEMEVLALPGLKAEGWLRDWRLFVDALGLVGVEIAAGGVLSERLYLAIMGELGSKEGWIPFN
ncbi:MAG: hypothetical protein M1829_003848 [Trizodia sp. TS-e1964]|nr:MAG: hypothetical protein M1829_003848 [Trizodia sp. TS-e1964]